MASGLSPVSTTCATAEPFTPPREKKKRPLPMALASIALQPKEPELKPTPEKLKDVASDGTSYRRIGSRPIASGAFGEVWKAKRISLEPRIPPSPEKLAAIKEAKGDKKLLELPIHNYLPPHPNLVNFFGALGLSGRRAAFTWAEGGSFISIKDRLSENAKHNIVLLDDSLRCLLSDVRTGLEHMHAHGIIHLDIKRANMLVSHEGVAMVADLGEAYAFGAPPAHNTGSWLKIRHISQAEDTPGTVLNAAPETLCAPVTAGPPADVWSLGLLAHEFLTGQTFVDTQDPTFGNIHLFMLGWRANEMEAPGSYAIHVSDRLAQTIPAGLPSGPWLHSMLTRILVLDPSHRPSVGALKSEPQFSQFTVDAPTLRRFIAASIAPAANPA